MGGFEGRRQESMVIDSHALMWWLEGSEELSEIARDILDEAEERAERHRVCAVTFWEMRWKEVRGQLQPKLGVRFWPALLADLAWLEIEETSVSIWLSTAELEWDHRDPADRIIAATALKYSEPVLTRDARFHEPDSPVKAVW
mgnify:CR=1 FL=1